MTNQTEAMREAFENHPQFRYLEFDRDKDARGRGKYKHSHIQALWEGFEAALSTLPRVTEEEMVELVADAIMNYEQNILIEGHPSQKHDVDTDTGFMSYARVALHSLRAKLPHIF